MKMLGYILYRIPDGGCSVNQLRRVIRRENPKFRVINVSRIVDRGGPTSEVQVDLRLRNESEWGPVLHVKVFGQGHVAKAQLIERRSVAFDMVALRDALPMPPSPERKRMRAQAAQ